MINWLCKYKYSSKIYDIFWNAVNCFLSAGQMAIILIFIARWNDMSTVGVINIGYALATLVVTLGRFGVRNYQVTDKVGKFSFDDYLYCRYLTTGAALILAALYVGIRLATGEYLLSKAILIFEIMFFRSIDSIEGCYLGHFQKIGKFVVGAKIAAIHQFLILAALCALIGTKMEVHLIFLICSVFSYVSLLCLVKMAETDTVLMERKWSLQNIKEMVVACFPICISTTIAIYVGNIPKYAIDWYLDENTQAIFGYIMLPVFAITLLNQFIYQPFVKDLGDLWQNKNYDSFRKNVFIQCIIVSVFSVLVFAFCILFGLKILSVIYSVDLMKYKLEFSFLLAGGCFYALAYYLTIPITTMRKQKTTAIGYLIVTGLAAVFQKHITIQYGMLGAAELYVIINVALFIIFLTIVLNYIHKEKCRKCEAR